MENISGDDNFQMCFVKGVVARMYKFIDVVLGCTEGDLIPASFNEKSQIIWCILVSTTNIIIGLS